MKFLFSIVLFVWTSAFAEPLKGAWHFTRTDGVVGTVTLSGERPSCVVYPAGKDINISVKVGKVCMQSPSCYEGAAQESVVKGTFRQSDGALVDGAVYFGKSFADLMDSYRKFGPDVVGPIGNDGQFPCPSTASAFLTIDGYVVHDQNENIVGYCLAP